MAKKIKTAAQKVTAQVETTPTAPAPEVKAKPAKKSKKVKKEVVTIGVDTVPETKELTTDEVVNLLAKLADEHGVTPQSIMDSGIAKQNGIKPHRVTAGMVHRAGEIQREMIEATKARAVKMVVDKGGVAVVDGKVYGKKEEGSEVKKNSNGGTGGKARIEILGHAMTAVIRWMGAQGWDFAKARAVLGALDVPAADNTVRWQLRAGRKDELPIAPLAADQEAKLNDLADKHHVPTEKKPSKVEQKKALKKELRKLFKDNAEVAAKVSKKLGYSADEPAKTIKQLTELRDAVVAAIATTKAKKTTKKPVAK